MDKFPNLNKDLEIKEKVVRQINEVELKQKCTQFKNIKMYDISPISMNRSIITVEDNIHKELLSSGELIISKIVRDKKDPCEMDIKIKKISTLNPTIKKGNIMHLTILKFEDNEILYRVSYNKFKITGKYVNVEKINKR